MKFSEALAIDQMKRDRQEQARRERRAHVERIRESEDNAEMRVFLGRRGRQEGR